MRLPCARCSVRVVLNHVRHSPWLQPRRTFWRRRWSASNMCTGRAPMSVDEVNAKGMIWTCWVFKRLHCASRLALLLLLERLALRSQTQPGRQRVRIPTLTWRAFTGIAPSQPLCLALSGPCFHILSTLLRPSVVFIFCTACQVLKIDDQACLVSKPDAPVQADDSISKHTPTPVRMYIQHVVRIQGTLFHRLRFDIVRRACSHSPSTITNLAG